MKYSTLYLAFKQHIIAVFPRRFYNLREFILLLTTVNSRILPGIMI